MSIFDKVCPECAEVNSTSATACHCGYSFLESERSFSQMSEDMIAEEERMYQEYLTARAKQAVEAAAVVKHQAQVDNEDSELRRNISRAEAEAKVAMADLEAQRARTAAANKIADKTKTKRQQKNQAKQRLEQIKQKREQAARAKAEQAQKAKAAAEQAKRAKAEAEQAQKAKAAAEQAKRAKAEAEAKKAIQAKAAAEQAKRAKAATEQAKRAKQATDKVKAAAAKAKQLASAAFKAAQAKKAQQALVAMQVKDNKKKSATNTSKPELHKTHAYKIKSNKAANAFRATQAARASSLAQYKECPNCTASVKQAAKRCNCGYSFPKGSTQLPGLSLNADEIIELKVNRS